MIINGLVRKNIEKKTLSPVYDLSENNNDRINSFDDTEISDFIFFFYRFVETAHIPIIGWDASYAITLFNLGAARLTGISSDKVLGQKIFTLFPDSQRDRSLSLIQQVHGPELGYSQVP